MHVDPTVRVLRALWPSFLYNGLAGTGVPAMHTHDASRALALQRDDPSLIHASASHPRDVDKGHDGFFFPRTLSTCFFVFNVNTNACAACARM